LQIIPQSYISKVGVPLLLGNSVCSTNHKIATGLSSDVSCV